MIHYELLRDTLYKFSLLKIGMKYNTTIIKISSSRVNGRTRFQSFTPAMTLRISSPTAIKFTLSQKKSL